MRLKWRLIYCRLYFFVKNNFPSIIKPFIQSICLLPYFWHNAPSFKNIMQQPGPIEGFTSIFSFINKFVCLFSDWTVRTTQNLTQSLSTVFLTFIFVTYYFLLLISAPSYLWRAALWTQRSEGSARPELMAAFLSHRLVLSRDQFNVSNQRETTHIQLLHNRRESHVPRSPAFFAPGLVRSETDVRRGPELEATARPRSEPFVLLETQTPRSDGPDSAVPLTSRTEMSTSQEMFMSGSVCRRTAKSRESLTFVTHWCCLNVCKCSVLAIRFLIQFLSLSWNQKLATLTSASCENRQV